MRRVFHKPYVYWFLLAFFAYVFLAIFLSEFYATLRFLPLYIREISWGEFLFSFFMTFAIAALVALNIVYGYILYQERKSIMSIRKESSVACAGTLVGLSTGVCPVCVTGVVPLIFSFFGISFSWLVLPFDGVEVQLLTILLLSGTLFFLHKKALKS